MNATTVVTNETVATNNKTVNLSVFIIPNSGCAFRQLIGDGEIELNKQLGIDASPGDKCLQVWVHCPDEEIDNCTDHGFSANICDCLGLPDNERAPTYMPMNLFLNVKEGETKTFTAPNGCKVNVKFEQLPYRYGRFGTIDETARNLIARTERNIAWWDENHR